MNSTKPTAQIRIGNRSIGDAEPCYIIAEVGNNHNGDFDRAIALVDAAVAAGADCAKFQMRKLDEVYRASTNTSARPGMPPALPCWRCSACRPTRSPPPT